MASNIAPPNPQDLLPPLLACLPLSAFSNRPPPALPALLSPILRQRLHVFSTGPASANSSWLPLLNWNRDEGAKLPPLLDQLNFEPHPVSGELEIDDVEEIMYRRLDSETFHARFELEQYRLVLTYLWCTGEANNSSETWLLAELKCLNGDEDNSMWHSSIPKAEKEFRENSKKPQADKAPAKGPAKGKQDADESDDDAYWAAYDSTPGRTPAKRSPAPAAFTNGGLFQRVSSSNELEYFNRYGSEVQPAMDPYDPAEDVAANSTLNHHSNEFVKTREEDMKNHALIGSDSVFEELEIENPVELVISVPDTPHHPRPLSASSGSSVERLEIQAERAENQAQVEVGIKQHISTDIKSLYRLARSVGISREEFGRIVQTELELLPLMDME